MHIGVLFHPDAACGNQPVIESQTAPPEPRSASYYTAIVRRNLFPGTDNAGDSPSDAGPPPAPDAATSVRALGLRLVGSIAGGSDTSRAIIQDTKSHTTGSYKLGDSIASATIEAIHRDAVVLRYQGRLLTLTLRSDSAGEAASKSPASNDKSDRNTDRQPEAKEATATAPADTQFALPQNRVGYVAEVLREATIEPSVRNGQVEGLKITGLENAPMAQLFGLKNGDVIQSVNGQPLTSKQRAFQVLMKATTQRNIDIRLLRDGKSKDLSFDL
jgi:general secretion pathway protein C